MGVAVHLGALELSAKAIIDRFGEENLKKGDVMIHNNPFPGGTHLPDVDVISPVYHRGELVAYSVSRGHHGDIGGMHPGSFAGDTVSIFQEGVRLPPIKLYDQGVLNEGVRDLFLANVRVPQFSWGDLQAQVAGCRLGERRIEELFEKHGAEAMKAAMEWALDYSEQLMRAEIEKMPDGTYTFADYPGQRRHRQGPSGEDPREDHRRWQRYHHGLQRFRPAGQRTGQLRARRCVFGHLLRHVQPDRSQPSRRTTAATARSPSSRPKGGW